MIRLRIENLASSVLGAVIYLAATAFVGAGCGFVALWVVDLL